MHLGYSVVPPISVLQERGLPESGKPNVFLLSASALQLVVVGAFS